MSLFNLADIRYSKPEKRNFQSVSKNYNSNVLKYPIDIGSADKGHYMLIHINTQEKTSYSSNLDPNNLPAIHRSRSRTSGVTNLGGAANNIFTGVSNFSVGGRSLSSSIGGIFEKKITEDVVGNVYAIDHPVGKTISNLVDRGEKFVGDIKGSLTGAPLNNVNFLRTIKRTKDSIALYMPNTLNFTHTQSYSDLNLGSETISGSAAIGSIISDYAQGKIISSQAIFNLTPFLGLGLKNIFENYGPNSLQAIFASAFGVVQNPMIELIYTRPNFRTFRFDFIFNPRSEKEAMEVYEIIQRLYFHQAPEISEGSAGYFLVPPSEFDIEFYYNGVQNPNIPKISTCVLETIDVDYAPGEFVTYEVPGENIPSPGRTGSPVSIRMSLSFRETEIVTKADYDAKKKNEIFHLNERDV